MKAFRKIISTALVLALAASTMICAHAERSAKLFEYHVIGGKYISLDKFNGYNFKNDMLNNDGSYTLPSEIDGYEVRTLGDFLFWDYDVPSKNIIISDNVTYIGETFRYNNDDDETEVKGSKLETIKIPESVNYIKERAFEFCTELKSIELPKSVREIGKSVFYGCRKLEKAVIKAELKSIPEGTFCGCSKLNSVELPDTLKNRIEEDAFGACESLKSISCNGSVFVYKSRLGFARGDKKIKGFTFNTRLNEGGLYEQDFVSDYASLNGFREILNLPKDNNKYYFNCGACFELKVSGEKLSDWKSGNPKKIKVTKDGKVTMLQKGTVKLTATFKNGITYRSTFVNDTNPQLLNSKGKNVKSLTIKKNSTKTVKLGGKVFTINNVYKNTKTAKFVSKKSEMKNLKIKGLKKGKTSLKLKVNGWKTFKINVKVV